VKFVQLESSFPCMDTKIQARKQMKSKGINTDHRYWFTRYTVLKIITAVGFEPEELLMADSYPTHNDLVVKVPIMREDIIVIAKFPT